MRPQCFLELCIRRCNLHTVRSARRLCTPCKELRAVTALSRKGGELLSSSPPFFLEKVLLGCFHLVSWTILENSMCPSLGRNEYAIFISVLARAHSKVALRVHGMDEGRVRFPVGPQVHKNLPCGRFLCTCGQSERCFVRKRNRESGLRKFNCDGD